MRCQEVVCLAVAGGRKPMMAVLYDELLRKEWEELSARKHSFDVASVVGVVNDKVLRDAKALHDKFFGAPAAPTVSCLCVSALGI